MPAHDGTWMLIGRLAAAAWELSTHLEDSPHTGPAQRSQEGADCRLSASGKSARLLILLTPRPARQGRDHLVRCGRQGMTQSNSRQFLVKARWLSRQRQQRQQKRLRAAWQPPSALSGSCQWRPETGAFNLPVSFDSGRHRISSAGKCRVEHLKMLLP